MKLIPVVLEEDAIARAAAKAADDSGLCEAPVVIAAHSDVITVSWDRAIGFFGCRECTLPGLFVRLVEPEADKRHGIVVPDTLLPARYHLMVHERSLQDSFETLKRAVAGLKERHASQATSKEVGDANWLLTQRRTGWM